jgi:hypothetical protein
MAVRFAVKSGNYSDPTVWDNGALPLSDDNVYPNGFTVTIDQNVTVANLVNLPSSVCLIGNAIPKMTGTTTPSGTAITGGNGSGYDAYLAYDQNVGTFWRSNVANTGWLGYQFPAGKIIKRYAFFTFPNAQYSPYTWTFQGSNDGTNWTTLDTRTTQTLSKDQLGIHIL